MFESSINLKSGAEIALMREAGRLNAQTLEAVKAAIRPGVSTGELNEVAESFQRAHGVYSPFKNYDPGNGVPFPGSICTSINEEMVHGIPGKRKLKEGDIISVDCGTVYEGFVGDSAFTVGVGEISEEAQRLIDVTKKALEIATALMVPGKRSGDVGAAIEAYVEALWFSLYPHLHRSRRGSGDARKPAAHQLWRAWAGIFVARRYDDRDGADGAGWHTSDEDAAQSMDCGFSGRVIDGASGKHDSSNQGWPAGFNQFIAKTLSIMNDKDIIKSLRISIRSN